MAKLGRHYRRVSAVFIWSYIKRLFSARDPSAGKEQLGYVQGGYRTVIETLASRVQKNGELHLGHEVSRVRADDGKRLLLRANDQEERFDRIVFTGPASVLNTVVGKELVEADDPSGQVCYLGVISLVLLTRKPLTPFYVLNLADESMPFTGVIGMSNVVPICETGEHWLTYFPSYQDSADPKFEQDDETLILEFLPAIKRLFPGLHDEDIASWHFNRARIVQPLQVLNYSRQVPQIRTHHPGLFVLNTGQFKSSTVNNNEVVRMASEFLDSNADAFPRSREGSA